MLYCPQCGHAYGDNISWPRRCAACGKEQFRNPIPVSVVLLPVDDGVLAIRRAIPPAVGKLALPGGFVNWGETWREAGSREVFEETSLAISPEELSLIGAESVSEGVILLFSVAKKRSRAECDWRADPSEVSEIVVLDQPCELGFSTHTEQLAAYFRSRKLYAQESERTAKARACKSRSGTCTNL